ncbi:MAG: hypothetical protein JST92_13155 [Deltaproteobacteria bacterium]|nr:hypothetical protein [Deltaproteobacteria bacterium]
MTSELGQHDTHSLSILRIYLRHPRGRRRSLWKRLVGRPLAHELAERALEVGVTCASVSQGHAGFAPGAKHVAAALSDVPPPGLPTCLELVAPRALLDTFVHDNAADLQGAVLVRVDGTWLRLGAA